MIQRFLSFNFGAVYIDMIQVHTLLLKNIAVDIVEINRLQPFLYKTLQAAPFDTACLPFGVYLQPLLHPFFGFA